MTKKNKKQKGSVETFDSKVVLKRLLGYLLRNKSIVFYSLITLVCTALVEASFAGMIQPIINDGFVNAKPWHLKWLAPLMFGLMFCRGVFGFFANYFTAKLGRHVIFDIRQDTFRNLITLPTLFFDRNSSSKNVAKLIYDAETTAVATTDTLTVMFKDTVLTIALISWLFYLDWRLTLIFLLTIPFLMGVTHYSNSRFRRTSKEIQDSMGGIANTVKEASLGQKVIKVYGGQPQELDNFSKANTFNFKQNLKRVRVSAAIIPVTVLVIAPAIAIILHIYLNYLRIGPESAGAFTSYFAACMMLTSPLKKLAKVNEKIQIGLTAANSVFNVIDAESEKDTGVIALTNCKGQLTFEDVSFNYGRDDGLSILNGISFDIQPGKRVALVGASGSGKSTLTSLILRFYAPESGRILLDGAPIDDIILRDLRNQFSLVSQETTLFDDTIGRNIMYGMLDDFDEQRLQAAIKAAHVDEFIDDLPDGLNTIVGEQGLRLSGGQRQRIAIARAIYKNAPILILDEATSALDNKSERYVQQALESLMKDRTSLVIAHRLSTIENADSILVMDKGQIVEQGSHAQLLKKGQAYADLYRAQSGSARRRGFFFWRS